MNIFSNIFITIITNEFEKLICSFLPASEYPTICIPVYSGVADVF